MARLATLFLSILAINAEAQTWCAPGAEWLFNFSSQQATGVRRAWYSGDTIVGGLPCQRIDQTVIAYQPVWPFGSPFTFQDQPFFTNEQGGLVQLWDQANSEFDTLAWYGAVPGDHWDLPGFAGFARFDVLDTGTRVVDGIPLHYLVVEEPIVMGVTDTLFERIGFEYWFLRPAESLVLDFTTTWLVCYKDNAIAQFDGWWPGNEPCDFSVGMVEGSAATFTLYPNPGTDRLNIELPAGPHTITVFDALGRTLRTEATTAQRVSFTMDGFAPGSYVVRVSDGSGISSFLRWVRQ